MLKITFCLVVALLAALVSAQATGVDVAGTNLTTVTATSAITCAQQCDGHAGCQGWSWDSCGKTSCVLKSSVTGRVINSCRTSDVHLGAAGFDRPGYDLPISPVSLPSGATASTCAYQCVNTAGCQAWAWKGTSCYLKWFIAAAVAASSVTSGVVGTNGLAWPNVPVLATVTLPANASAADCANKCDQTTGCAAWTIAVAGSSCSTSAVNTCYLRKYVSSCGGLVGLPLASCQASGLSDRFFDTTLPGGAVFNVSSVSSVGNQSDTHLAPVYPSRDGGAVGTIGNKIVWYWSDTTYTSNGAFNAFYGNTGAIGNPTNPLNMTGPKRQAIPFSANESAFNKANSPGRVVLWPKSGVVETTPGFGYIWVPKGYWDVPSNVSQPNQGMEISSVTIGSDGFTNVTRLSDVPIFPKGYPMYGSLAAVRDAKYVYLYSLDKVSTWTTSTYVARAPLTSPSVLSSYQYYDNAAGTWSATAPNATSTNTSKAIFTTSFGIDGNVYYSSYHRLWVLIFNYHGDEKVYLRTAPAPQGPWSKDTLLFTAPTSDPTYIYGTTGTCLYDLSGKTSSVDFTWPYKGGYANWVLQVNFQ